MQEKQFEVLLGALLQDVDQLMLKAGESMNYAACKDILQEKATLADENILEQIGSAAGYEPFKLPFDSLAFISQIAHKIAACADDSAELRKGKSDENILLSIFNVLNDNTETQHYTPALLSESINFPKDEVEKGNEQLLAQSLNNLYGTIRTVINRPEKINLLIQEMERSFSYIPACTENGQATDVSFYDHARLTAALASCIYQYSEEKKFDNYRQYLAEEKDIFLQEKAFLIYSLDLSGIQDFIYTVATDGALKAMRVRSLYLELLMENLVDDLIERCQLARTNIIYCGGGHSYLLLANTKATRALAEKLEKETNDWLLRTFKTTLYVGCGYAACSANDICNRPDGAYKEIFREIANEISRKKLCRYDARQIIALNSEKSQNTERECRVCHRTSQLTESGKCRLCEAMEDFSRLSQTNSYYTVHRSRPNSTCLPLPGDKFITADPEHLASKYAQDREDFVRCYAKNKIGTQLDFAVSIWSGDYQNGNKFEDLVENAPGVKRIGVLRADIDNLGQAFVQGFENKNYKANFNTLSRTSAFSRKLAQFFKLHINGILEQGQYQITEKNGARRKATVVYSGGDDLFVIGSWSDIIGFSVDLQRALKKYSQNTLTISAGIGMYSVKTAVTAMARQTGELEEAAKEMPKKNSVAIFSQDNAYSWDVFIEEVLEKKYRAIKAFFDTTDAVGSTFLLNLLELMIDTVKRPDEKINIARFAYVLARMKPKNRKQQMAYQQFAEQMYGWIQDKKQCRQAITAIRIYQYTVKGQET